MRNEAAPAPAPGTAKGGASDPLTVELYKSLRTECASYIEKIPGLWLQKFTLVGATVAFIVTQGERLDTMTSNSAMLNALAISIVPILAILIDVRTLEYGLHARAISLFISENFTAPEVLAKWEETLWRSDGGLSPVVLRSLLSVIVTVVPTMGITVLSLTMVGVLTQRVLLSSVLAALVCAVYCAATVGAGVIIWRRRPRRANEPTDQP
jgi:CRISPR/Cas system CMR-associated protein Cmr5 small subunit